MGDLITMGVTSGTTLVDNCVSNDPRWALKTKSSRPHDRSPKTIYRFTSPECGLQDSVFDVRLSQGSTEGTCKFKLRSI